VKIWKQISYHEEHKEQNFKVTLADTDWESMTGGRVKRVAKYIDRDNFMVTYGDGVADVGINKLADFYKSHGKLATITAVQPVSRSIQIQRYFAIFWVKNNFCLVSKIS
jgi:glucose-1-phosphate cytidylyltransferase